MECSWTRGESEGAREGDVAVPYGPRGADGGLTGRTVL